MIYYVDSVNGDDGNCGTQENAPLRSLERVNGLKLQPGSEIRFCRGGSWKGMLVLRDSGTRFEPIRISSYGEGEMPEIDGCGAWAGIWLNGCSHVIVENLKVANRAEKCRLRQGICVEGRAEGITEYVTVRNCEILEVSGQNGREEPVYESMYWNGGIYVTMPGRSSAENHLHHIHLLGNYIHDVTTSGIRINQEEDFINDIHHTCVVVR